MTERYTYTLCDFTRPDTMPGRAEQAIFDAARDEGTPTWIIVSGAVLCVVGLLLIGAIAGHVWSMAACIDPGSFGLSL